MRESTSKQMTRAKTRQRKAQAAELEQKEEEIEEAEAEEPTAAATAEVERVTHRAISRFSTGRKSSEKSNRELQDVLINEDQIREEKAVASESDDTSEDDESSKIPISRVKDMKFLWPSVKRFTKHGTVPRSEVLNSMAIFSKMKPEENFNERERGLADIGFERWQSNNPEKSRDEAPSDYDLMVLEYRRLIDEEGARESFIEAGTEAERQHNLKERERRRSTPKPREDFDDIFQARRGLRVQPQKTTDHLKEQLARKADFLTMAIHAPNSSPTIFGQGKFYEDWALEKCESYLDAVKTFKEGKDQPWATENFLPSIERRLTENYFFFEEMDLDVKKRRQFIMAKRYRILRLKNDGVGKSQALVFCESEICRIGEQVAAAEKALDATRDFVPERQQRRAAASREDDESIQSREIIDLRDDVADLPFFDDASSDTEDDRERQDSQGQRREKRKETRSRSSNAGGLMERRDASEDELEERPKRQRAARARARSGPEDEDLPDLLESSDDDRDDINDKVRRMVAARLRAIEDPGDKVRGVQCISDEDFEHRRRALDREQRILDELREKREARGRSERQAAPYSSAPPRDRSRDSSRTGGVSVLGSDSDDDGDGSMLSKLSRKRIVVQTEQVLNPIPLYNLACMQASWKDYNRPRSTKPTAKEIFKSMDPKCEEMMFSMIKWSSANAAVRAQLGDPLRVKKDWDADRIYKMASLLLQGRVGPHQVQNVQMSMDANIGVAFQGFVYEATAAGNSEFQQRGDKLLRGHGEPTVADAFRGIVVLRDVLTIGEANNLRKQAAAVARLLMKNAEMTNAYCSLMTALEKSKVLSTTSITDPERFVFLRDWFMYFMEEMAIVSHALLDGLRLGLVLGGGTKADWERGQTNPQVSPFERRALTNGDRPAYEKRQRNEDWRPTSAAGDGAAPARSSIKEACVVCNRPHGGDCLMKEHSDANNMAGRLWKDHPAAKKGLSLKPPMTSLNSTYSMSGNVLPEHVRQVLADTRNRVMGREMKKVLPQAEVSAWGASERTRGIAAYSAPSGGASRSNRPQGRLSIVIDSQNLSSAAPHTQVELCECVEACSFELLKSYTNKCSVTLSAWQIVPVEDRALATRAGTTALAADTKSVDTVARLDTGANCNDYISRELADMLIEMGSPVIPTTGRVCGAFERVGRVMTTRLKCNYKFINVHTLLQEEIVIEPVILDDLIAPLIVGLQTVGQYNLLQKQLPTLCRDTMDTKHPLTCSPSNGVLRGAKRAIGLYQLTRPCRTNTGILTAF